MNYKADGPGMHVASANQLWMPASFRLSRRDVLFTRYEVIGLVGCLRQLTGRDVPYCTLTA